jgi:hypothetical protein
LWATESRLKFLDFEAFVFHRQFLTLHFDILHDCYSHKAYAPQEYIASIGTVAETPFTIRAGVENGLPEMASRLHSLIVKKRKAS